MTGHSVEDTLEYLRDGVTVVTRYYDPSTDEAFIYSSWRNSSFYLRGRAAFDVVRAEADEFFSRQTRRIREILKTADVLIACHEDSPLVIVGYSVCTGRHLDWIYVKADYRGKGIGRLLVPPGTETFTSDVTRIGEVIAFKKKLTLKENAHGNGNEENREAGAPAAGASAAVPGSKTAKKDA